MKLIGIGLAAALLIAAAPPALAEHYEPAPGLTKAEQRISADCTLGTGAFIVALEEALGRKGNASSSWDDLDEHQKHDFLAAIIRNYLRCMGMDI